jgi:hypothetical protein
MRYVRVAIWLVTTGLLLSASSADDSVSVQDGGPKMNRATWECTPGHMIRKRNLTIDSGAQSYMFAMSGCMDPSHGDQHPSSEGTFGMPTPSRANWYAGGFLKVMVNGVNATLYQTERTRVLETGERGSFQTIWAHPDAEVGIRLLMLPGGNHVLVDLAWIPRGDAVIETVALNMTCYPSFFTTANQRVGDRHCKTPGADESEPNTLELIPSQDTWLYYYDTVFDVANGEGVGPCALLLDTAAVASGTVHIGGYAVSTVLNLKPETGEVRLGLYDFTGLTNAQADNYLTQHAADDLAELLAMDFRPMPVQELDVAALTAEATGLLTDAAEDGATLKPQVDEMLAQVAELEPLAAAGDWEAEGELSDVLRNSSDAFWKLRAFAVLNR